MPNMVINQVPKLLTGPSAWLGKDLVKESNWIISWTSSQIADLENAGKYFLSLNQPLENISPSLFPIPKLKPQIDAISNVLLNGRGFVLLKGLPVEKFGVELSAVIYLGLGVHLGNLRSNNAKGHLLGHVKDQGADIQNRNVRFYQTNKKLDFHTDSADLVGLLCLQKAKAGGESYIASSMSLFNEISLRRPDLIEALFTPFPTDRRGEIPDGCDPWYSMPIFTWYENQLTCTYIRQYIDAAQRNFPEVPRLSDAQIEAMNLIDSILAEGEIVLPMAFEPGDIQILNNHQILHSRSDFENWPEPERHRHLLRLWIAPMNARPLPNYYEPRWISTTPGKRGGIIVAGAKPTVQLEPH
ncbi:taurine catabolism dioxygenase TauD [Polynucleobacter antarcticus]|uniref:Taurine catabolism dioxygenase TauD n=2 Tax=Polynucleobacter antarcticus TaxID=1743162 RepID=A0A6M9PP96_9BURK|nr:taurine catabolism dioxygenase TauD [Polynucleobacter antarcticus]